VNFYRIGFSITALPSLSLCFVCIWMSDRCGMTSIIYNSQV
jgi:hypothetical protein